jgi:hypothetical protein
VVAPAPDSWTFASEVFKKKRRAAPCILFFDTIVHRLGKLALEPARSGDRIDNVAALFVHDDAARPNRA